MNQPKNFFIIRNSMANRPMQIQSRPPQPPQEDSKCICKSSPGEITIEIDRATAFEFSKAWNQQTTKKKFKLSFNPEDLKSNPQVLNISNVSPVHKPDQDEGIYEISIDDVGKIMKLVKVEDGTFHYQLESNDIQVQESNNDITMEEIAPISETNEISGVCKSEEGEILEIHSGSPTVSYTTVAQNRPPVIIKHGGETPQFLSNEQVFENTIMDFAQSTVDNNEQKLQKQKFAEVAPFHHNQSPKELSQWSSKETPKRTPKGQSSKIAQRRAQITPQQLNEEFKNCRIQIGPNNTTVSGSVYKAINWTSVRDATRKLLTALFPREVLASHSLTGKPSPAFRNLPKKERLDPNIVEDIIHIVSSKCNVDARTVRGVITLKCADENKMLRLRKAKEKRMNANQAHRNFNKENCAQNQQ